MTPLSRRPQARSLAALAAPTLAPAFARFGFDEAGLLTRWADIVGGRLAARCRPLRLQWPPAGSNARQDATAATLVVSVEGAFALELQHLAPLVIERINAHVGWRCVGRLTLRQGPLPAAPAARVPVADAGAAATAEAERAVASIAERPLRDALARLGARVFADRAS